MNVSEIEVEGETIWARVNGEIYGVTDTNTLLDADGYPLDISFQAGEYGAELRRVREAILSAAEGGR